MCIFYYLFEIYLNKMDVSLLDFCNEIYSIIIDKINIILSNSETCHRLLIHSLKCLLISKMEEISFKYK